MERLNSLKSFCFEHAEHKEIRKRMLNEVEWEHVKELILTLQPLNKYVKMLQAENITLSDFFGFWTSLRIKVSKNDDELSKNLLSEMNFYHARLIENPALAAAVFMDPRYQRALKGDQEIAIYFLTSLHRKIRDNEMFGFEEPETLNTINQSSENESLEELQTYLNACGSITSENTHQNYLNVNNRLQNEIIIHLHEFIGIEEPLTTSILEYWEKQKQARPELYKLASVLYAIPPTQSTVERCFSSLPIVMTSRRTKLGVDCLQNILLIRLNNKHYNKDNKTKQSQRTNTIEFVEVEVEVS